MSSSAAIYELSKGKKRYRDADSLLDWYARHRVARTAKEVAHDMGWTNDQYANAPKRCHELMLNGYLEIFCDRRCERTGKVAHCYMVTDKGLVKAGVNGAPKSVEQGNKIVVTNVDVVKTKPVIDFAAIKAGLH